MKELARKMTGLPVITGHELSAALGIDLRAETAVLNGRLIPIVSKFFDDVEGTFRAKGINAPIMVYKGDGSVMGLDEARLHPIETILSGPAASAMGGMILSGYEDCVMVDIGGTSTDIAVMEGGFPQIQYEGASIGRWRTRVKAVDMYTVALGGDSKISVYEGQKFMLGPDRVVPLCVFSEKHPDLPEKVRHSEISEYYETVDDADTSYLTPKEKRIFDAIQGKGALNKMDIVDIVEGLWVIDDELASMVRKEVLVMSALTPTDVMVYKKMLRGCRRPGAGGQDGHDQETGGRGGLRGDQDPGLRGHHDQDAGRRDEPLVRRGIQGLA